MPLNVAAFLKSHRMPVILVGGGAAAGLGLYARAKGKVPSSAGGQTSSVSAQPGGAQGTYDSTAQDVYNSIEPQIQDLADQLNKLGGTVTDQAGMISTALGAIPPPSTNGTPAAAPGAGPSSSTTSIDRQAAEQNWAAIPTPPPPPSLAGYTGETAPIQPVNPASLPAPVGVATYQPPDSPAPIASPAGSQVTPNVFVSRQVETWDTVARMTGRTADDLYHMNIGTGIAGNQPIPAGTHLYY